MFSYFLVAFFYLHLIVGSFLQHCAGINCLALLTSAASDGSDYLFTGSRDGRLKRWALGEDAATCSATFESHVDWVILLSISVRARTHTHANVCLYILHLSGDPWFTRNNLMNATILFSTVTL